MSGEQDSGKSNAIALDPAQSVVIEACAGSGKTWLLVSRMIRLLLAGVRPSEILAITFTRKAAQEMQARLHDWLRLLATADDEQVKQFLREREVAEGQLDTALSRARLLFETFLTDSPGITINTFHGWFLQLLKRAPLAAGAASGASLVDRTSPLIDEAWEVFADGLQHNPDSPVARALNWLFETYGLDSTRKLLTNFLSKRAEWWAYTHGKSQPVPAALEQLRTAMPVAPDADLVDELRGDALFDRKLVEYGGYLERNATKSDVGLAEKLGRARQAGDHDAWFADIWRVFMSAGGDLRKRSENNAVAKRLGTDGQRRFLALHEEIGTRLERVNALRSEQAMYRLNEAGLMCGAELLDRYQLIKNERGLIDYTDVEWRAWKLLTNSDYAEYMQYRLDARYKHILLDEFQDTNPLQWQILKSWLQAATETDSRPGVFLVGDPKQSIYRFRRAEPRLFAMAREYLRKHFGAQALEQNVTRRNAPAIVSAVNALFAPLIRDFARHVAHRDALPGQVEVLPLVGATAVPDLPGDWRNPIDTPRADVLDQRRAREADEVARTLAQMVGHMQIDEGERMRPLRYEDIYLLVRRRTHLDTYERALRHAQIPYLSTRQGGLLDTLEAADLTALLQFLVVPFADIHLATALRSPLLSASDEDLVAISGAEGRNWWQKLSRLVGDECASPTLVRAHRLLNRWIRMVDVMPVHDLLDRIYFEADVMRRYDAAVPAPMRAGVAANLRAFMQVALSTDSGRYPSLQGFLHELASMRRAAAEEAPDVGVITESSNAVRILTVHGAKGLEAPVVWLLDANSAGTRADSYDVVLDWPPEADAPAHFSLYSRMEERGESRMRVFELNAELAAREDVNLLYVAMTRAQQVLKISGIETSERGESWYRRLAELEELPGGRPSPPMVDASAPASPAPEPSIGQSLEALRRPLNVGSRSGDLVDPRRRYGTLLHLLLEKIVPPVAVTDPDYLQQVLSVSREEFESLWKAAHAIIDEPDLARFFDPSNYVRAENELAYVSGDGELRRIDRVVEFEDEIWVLDYKTGDAADPQHPERAALPYRKQLEEYRLAVGELIPGKPVRAALVFSGGMFVPV